MTLEDFLSKQKEPDVALFRAKLRALDVGSPPHQRMHASIWRESRLPTSVWEGIFQAVLDATGVWSDVAAAIRKCCQGKTLQGPPARCPAGIVFGRAVTPDSLARAIRGNYPKINYASIDSARKAVDGFIGASRSTVVTAWKDVEIARYLMWSTFQAVGRPFAAIPARALDVKKRLGLPRRLGSRRLLLIEYVLPSGVVPKFPTIVEACASDPWNYYFSPSSNPNWGLTVGWDDEKTKDAGGLPEVVHDVVNGQCLAEPISQVE